MVMGRLGFKAGFISNSVVLSPSKRWCDGCQVSRSVGTKLFIYTLASQGRAILQFTEFPARIPVRFSVSVVG